MLMRLPIVVSRDYREIKIGQPMECERPTDNGKTTGLGGEDVNLIGALSHIAEETFDGIGGLNVSVQRRRKIVKCDEVLFIFSQASHRFWIALSVLGW